MNEKGTEGKVYLYILLVTVSSNANRQVHILVLTIYMENIYVTSTHHKMGIYCLRGEDKCGWGLKMKLKSYRP